MNLIKKKLKSRLRKGMKARFVIGLGYYHTDPELLEELFKLSQRNDLKLLLSAKGSGETFHPKIYVFENPKRATVMVGSANLTKGGLFGNHEASLLFHEADKRLSSEIDTRIDQMRKDGDVVVATSSIIRRYKVDHAVHKAQQKLSGRRARRKLTNKSARLDTLNDILSAMIADDTEKGFKSQLRVRKNGRREANQRLTEIATARRLSRQRFLDLYGDLCNGLWHSGGLQRNKNSVANNRKDFQTAIRAIRNLRSLSVEGAYNQLSEDLEATKGAGVNIITEILHTLDNRRFAVMNKNSVSGMILAQITNFPDRPIKGNVDGEVYKRFCWRAAKIRKELGLKNFTELDALFNYAYWGEDNAQEIL